MTLSGLTPQETAEIVDGLRETANRFRDGNVIGFYGVLLTSELGVERIKGGTYSSDMIFAILEFANGELAAMLSTPKH
jgi:hypothetical protein